MPDPIAPPPAASPDTIEVTPTAAPASPAPSPAAEHDAIAAALAAIEGAGAPAEPATETPAEGDPESTEGDPEITPPDDSATAKWAAMVERDRLARESALAQEQQAPAPPESPLAALEAAGFTPDQFLNAYLGVEDLGDGTGADPEAPALPEDPRIAKLESQLQELRGQQQDYVLQAEVARISGVLAKDKERWPWAATHLGGEAEQLALQVAHEYFRNTKESIEYEEALDLVNAHIRDQFEGTQKRYAHLTSAAPPKPIQGSRPNNSDPQPASMLGAGAGDTPSPADTDEERIARALKAVGG